MSLNTLGIRTEALINIVERMTGNTEVVPGQKSDFGEKLYYPGRRFATFALYLHPIDGDPT